MASLSPAPDTEQPPLPGPALPLVPGPEAELEARWGWGLLCLAVAVGAALRLHLAFFDHGIYWPDEIYQGLEPAHRWVFGYGLVAWEFVEGARNWTFPAGVALLLGLARLLGLDDPAGYLGLVRGAFALLGAATAWACFRLARAVGATTLGAAAGAIAFALCAPAIYFAPRALSENASALAVAAGLAILLAPERSRGSLVLGASLLGLATLLRLQSGMFCVGLLAILAAQRRMGALWVCALTLGGWALAYGALDWASWGRPFHSALVYLRFNLLDGKASQWGTSGSGYYLRVLHSSMPALAGVSAVLALAALGAWRRVWPLFVLLAGYVLLHSWVPHKELRFILPALPLAFALSGRGADLLARHLPRALPIAALLLASALSAATHRSLTFGQLGQYEQSRPGASAYDDGGAVNRLLMRAGRREDVCGLKVEAVHLAWTGGYTYFHRPVPLYPHFGPPRGAGLFNHVITHAGMAGGGEVLAEDAGRVLLRLPGSGCRPDSGYSWRLP